MKLFTLACFAVSAVSSFAAPLGIVENPNDLVSIQYQDLSDINVLADLGFRLERRPSNGVAVLRASSEEQNVLRKHFEVSNFVEEARGPPSGYRSHDELSDYLHDLVKGHEDIAKIYSIGESVRGRDLWVVEISDNVGQQELGEPAFAYIGNMHGDEIVGRELLTRFASMLLDGYSNDHRIKRMINDVRIYIIPTMNPDGFEAGSRYNAKLVDLNRNFPDRISDPVDSSDGRQVETQAVMAFLRDTRPAMGANMHGGAVCVNYPYDSNESGRSEYTASPDDDWYVWASLEYSRHNEPMYNSRSFKDGITNGADWYPLYGGLQDWSYTYLGMPHVTVEVSNSKSPPYSSVDQLWEENRESLMAYLEVVYTGVSGIVRNEEGDAIPDAVVRLAGIDKDTPVHADDGEFYRVAKAGTYTVEASAPGYKTVSKSVMFDESEVVWMPFTLERTE
eukprot:Rmarinus@m.3349